MKKTALCMIFCFVLFYGCGQKDGLTTVKDAAGIEALEIAHAYQNGEIEPNDAMTQLIMLSYQTDNEELGKAINQAGLDIGSVGFAGESSANKSIEKLEMIMGERTESTDHTGANGVDTAAVDILSSGQVIQSFETDDWDVTVLSYDMGYPEHMKNNVGVCYICIKTHVKNKSQEKNKFEYVVHTYLDGKESNHCFMDFYKGGLTTSNTYNTELLGGAEADLYLCYSFDDSSIPKEVIMQYDDETVIQFSIADKEK